MHKFSCLLCANSRRCRSSPIERRFCPRVSKKTYLASLRVLPTIKRCFMTFFAKIFRLSLMLMVGFLMLATDGALAKSGNDSGSHSGMKSGNSDHKGNDKNKDKDAHHK